MTLLRILGGLFEDSGCANHSHLPNRVLKKSSNLCTLLSIKNSKWLSAECSKISGLFSLLAMRISDSSR